MQCCWYKYRSFFCLSDFLSSERCSTNLKQHHNQSSSPFRLVASCLFSRYRAAIATSKDLTTVVTFVDSSSPSPRMSSSEATSSFSFLKCFFDACCCLCSSERILHQLQTSLNFLLRVITYNTFVTTTRPKRGEKKKTQNE